METTTQQLEHQLELCEHCELYHKNHPSAHCAKFLDIEIPCPYWTELRR